MSTWFPAAVADLPADVLLDLRREDQELSADLLRDGTVMAAVTADPRAVQGCRVRRLGAMRYLAVAAPGPPGPLVRRRAGRRGVRRRAPAGVQPGGRPAGTLRGVRRRPAHRDAAVHYVPSQSAFVGLVEAGLGWGMVPEVAAASAHRAPARSSRSGPAGTLDVPLYWQHWALRTPTLDDLTERVVRARLRRRCGRSRTARAGRRPRACTEFRVLTPPPARQVIW